MPRIARRSGTGRRVRRRRTRRTRKTGSMRLMRSVARRTMLSLAEAKRFSVINELFTPTYATPLVSQWTLRSVFAVIPTAISSLSNANSSYNRVGSEIVDPLLKLKITGRVDWGQLGGTGNYRSLYMHVYLIATTDETNTPGIVTNYDFSSGDPGWFIQTDAARPTLNGNNIKVLKHWRRRLTPDQGVYPVVSGQTTNFLAVGGQDVSGQMTYRWKRKLTYQDATPSLTPNFPSGSQLRGWNYYILAGWGVTGPSVVSAARPQILIDSFVYFKDP